MPSLSVLIATHKRPDLLQRTLTYLAACDRPAEFRGVVVVENGGKFGAEAVVREFSSSLSASYCFEPIANKSVALNRAIPYTTSNLIIFLDDDVRVGQDFLVAYARAVGDCAGGTYFGGPVEVDYEMAPPAWLLPYLPASVLGRRPPVGSQGSTTLTFLGANWAAFSEDLRRAGGFDTSMGPGQHQSVGEDTAMQRQLQRRGVISRYVEEAVLWHFVPKDHCTPKWALRRACRHAMLERADPGQDCPRLFGVPRWMYIELVKRRLRSLMASVWERDPARRHEIHHRYWTFKGWMRGLRQGCNGTRQVVSTSETPPSCPGNLPRSAHDSTTCDRDPHAPASGPA
jgi:cellulose synthase/poly-beta-1,6-N-acetylglucosamine synthase-like glycosyltransferase